MGAMRTISYFENSLPSALPKFIPTWDRQIARLVSNIANPALLASLMVVVAASVIRSSTAWIWALIGIFASTLLPVSYISWMLLRGKVTDFDIYHRTQRNMPYLVTLACGAITVAAMLVGEAPMILIILSAAGLTQTFLMFLINQFWKISAHAAGMASFSIALLFLVGITALPALLGIPLMVWSRVRLHRHTILQTLAGTVLGMLVFLSFLKIFIG